MAKKTKNTKKSSLQSKVNKGYTPDKAKRRGK